MKTISNEIELNSSGDELFPNGSSLQLTLEKQMKVALYSRVSTDKQANGLDSQKFALEEHCRVKGITEYEVFEDFNVSGSKSSRPQLDKMMKEVREGKISTVIVYSFSRFARSTKMLIDTLYEFELLKVNFISVSENLDLSTPLGRAMFTIISALATLERELISEKSRLGVMAARARGKQIGRPRTVADDVIVALRADGYSYREIAKMLKVGQGSITAALRRTAQIQKSSIP